jgi:hypothetical protein
MDISNGLKGNDLKGFNILLEKSLTFVIKIK